jgi:hypothetical protein
MSVQPPVLEEKQCYSRIVPTGHFLYFGDGKHRFYLESRCPNNRLEGRATCERCIVKIISKYQYTSNYQHGLIYEPIPHHSHLFGGLWYEENAKKWGDPSAKDLAHAIRSQTEARRDLSKVTAPIESNKMPRPRKKSIPPFTAPKPEPEPEPEPPKELRISTDVPLVPQAPQLSQAPSKVKRVRRPVAKKMSPMSPVLTPMESSTYPPSTSLSILGLFQPPQETDEKTDVEVVEKEEEKQQEKPRRGRKKAETEPKKKVTKKASPLIHKDSCIPTHKEEEIEEHNIEDYETEDVLLSIFILDGMVYFRDSKKNKLYRRIKEKTIGQYVGRYDPYTDSLVTDVPDSDDEEEQEDE